MQEANEIKIYFYLLFDYFVTIDEGTSLEVALLSPNQSAM